MSNNLITKGYLMDLINSSSKNPTNKPSIDDFLFHFGEAVEEYFEENLRNIIEQKNDLIIPDFGECSVFKKKFPFYEKKNRITLCMKKLKWDLPKCILLGRRSHLDDENHSRRRQLYTWYNWGMLRNTIYFFDSNDWYIPSKIVYNGKKYAISDRNKIDVPDAFGGIIPNIIFNAFVKQFDTKSGEISVNWHQYNFESYIEVIF